MKASHAPRRTILKAAALGAASLSVSQFSLQNTMSGEKPNVLLIMTDDQGWGDVRSHGNDSIDTPVMDRLASEGARFERFYVSPVCAPTRASLLTGRYHLRAGVHGVTRGYETMRDNEVTIAEILKDAGYATGCFGKWHNGAHYPYDPNGQGFDEFLGFCAGHWNNYFDTILQHNDTMVKTKGYIADVVTDAAVNFIGSNRNRPFFCYVPYNPPHSPFQVPDSYFEKYKKRGLDDELACVYGMCENIDDNTGRLLGLLDDLKLAENTIVIFLTDNGPNTNRFNGGMRGRKGSVHEGGIRVPCFIRWPGHIAEGTAIGHISSHIDLLPTIAEMCGISGFGSLPLDGINLAPLLTGNEADRPDRMIFTHWAGRGSVRTQRFRLTCEGERIELFDMSADPAETVNVAEKYPGVFNRLKSAYDGWYDEVTVKGFDPIPIPVGYDESPVVELPGHEGFLCPPGEEGISYVGRSGWANDYITNWISTESYVYWEVDVVREGAYDFMLLYRCPEEDTGSEIRMEIAGEILNGRVSEAYSPGPVPSPDRVLRKEVYEHTWAELHIGTLQLRQGKTRLSVAAVSMPGKQVMELKAVKIRKLR